MNGPFLGERKRVKREGGREGGEYDCLAHSLLLYKEGGKAVTLEEALEEAPPGGGGISAMAACRAGGIVIVDDRYACHDGGASSHVFANNVR